MIVVAGLVAAVRRCWESGALKEFFRALLRTVQTWFPGLVDAKYVTQRSIRRVLRRPSEYGASEMARTLSSSPGSTAWWAGRIIDAAEGYGDD